LVFLRGVLEGLLDTLHLLAGGDICQLPYDDINTIFRNHSRAAKKRGRGSQLLASTPLSSSFLKNKFANQMEDFKSEMRQTIANRECKGHPKLIKMPIKPLPCLLGVPLLILPHPHPVLGRILLNVILN